MYLSIINDFLRLLISLSARELLPAAFVVLPLPVPVALDLLPLGEVQIPVGTIELVGQRAAKVAASQQVASFVISRNIQRIIA